MRIFFLRIYDLLPAVLLILEGTMIMPFNEEIKMMNELEGHCGIIKDESCSYKSVVRIVWADRTLFPSALTCMSTTLLEHCLVLTLTYDR